MRVELIRVVSMSNILAIESSTSASSVALFDGDVMLHLEHSAPRGHARFLLGAVEGLLTQCSLPKSSLSAIAFTEGPGSFTGLRIGFGFAQGLAYALDVPMVPICSLRAMAAGALEVTAAPSMLAVIDARMGEVYWQVFDTSVGTPVEKTLPQLSAIGELGAATKLHSDSQTLIVHAELDAGALAVIHAQLPPARPYAYRSVSPRAVDVARLGFAQMGEGKVVAAADAQLLYVRNSVAWAKSAPTNPIQL